ncbi:MAG: lysozyme inhibitor LprI family protein [Roseovarius sp.]
MRLALALLFAASPAMAQELTYDWAPTASCVAAATDYDTRQACIGRAAEACMEATPGGYSTVGMSGCTSRETDDWDARLNAVYREIMAQAKTADEENKEYGGYAPSQAEALRDMQRAWIAFRDAKCMYERSQWGGGTGAGPAGASCYLYETARQTLYLEASRMGG